MENILIGSGSSRPHPYTLFQEKVALLENIKSQIKAKQVFFIFYL